jgi:hypothetical protein
MTLKDAREQFKTKQDALAAIFANAKTDTGEYDFARIDSDGFKDLGPVQRVERVNELNAELNTLFDEIVKLEKTEKGWDDLQSRMREAKGPESGKAAPKHDTTLGRLVTERPEFKHMFVDKRFKGGHTFSLDQVRPSEILAKVTDFDTVGNIGFKTLFETGAGWAPQSIRLPGFVEAVSRPIQVLDIIPIGQTQQAAIVFMEETTRTHAAAEKAEGVAFAESTFELTEKTSNVRKITDSVPVTDEQLEDVAMAESYLNGRLVFGLRQRLDGQILAGDGIAPNLQGLNTLTGILTQALGADPIPDAIFKAGRQIRVTGRAMPTHVLLHPSDWEEIRLLRTADGIYIWGNPSEAGPERIWGWPVVQEDIVAAGTGFVGSFQPQWVSLFERRGVDVQVGYSGTQFLEGKRTVRADVRMALVFFRPAAFCKVTGI